MCSVPGSEFLKGLLVGIRSHPAGSAECAGRSAGRDQGWDSIDGTGASGGDVANAIGTEKGAGLRTSCDTQQ